MSRMSCSVLQRQPTPDQNIIDQVLTIDHLSSTHIMLISLQLKKTMLEQPELTEHDVSHMSQIDHNNCKYEDRPFVVDLNDIEESLNPKL